MKSKIEQAQIVELTEEERNLIKFFDEVKKNQITFIEDTGKRIIELSTGLLGLLFAVIAFGNDFPPAYIEDTLWMQIVLIAILAAFLFAILAGVLTVNPKEFIHSEYGVDDMKQEYKALLRRKSCWMKAATTAFFSGTLGLALLIIVLILGL